MYVLVENVVSNDIILTCCKVISNACACVQHHLRI